MTRPKEPNMMANTLIQMALPAIVFIGSAAVMHSQVSDIKVGMSNTAKSIQSIAERLTRVEEKVIFLYDERKKGN